MKCPICNKEFEGRADAKFCSDKCRKTSSRLSVTIGDDLSVTNGTDVTDNVTDKLTVEYANTKPTVTAADRKYLKNYQLQMKFIQDLKDGVVGNGSLRGKTSIPGLNRAKNPWPDLLKTPQDQELLGKVLGNYF